MPIYGYRCGSCGHEFEILQRMSDPPLKTCPKCAGELHKMVYAAGIIYKGSGYYNTDYKSTSRGSDSSSEKGSDKSSDKGSDKADSKSSETAASNGAGSSSESSGDAKPAPAPKTESTTSKSDSNS
jgi:putative FmdB family regulatory protein